MRYVNLTEWVDFSWRCWPFSLTEQQSTLSNHRLLMQKGVVHKWYNKTWKKESVISKCQVFNSFLFHFGCFDLIMLLLVKQHGSCETKIIFNDTKGTCNLSNTVQAPCQVSEWFLPTLLIVVFLFSPTSFFPLTALFILSGFIFHTYFTIPFLIQILVLLKLWVVSSDFTNLILHFASPVLWIFSRKC